jgi:Spy/CpxP family protein refolding chaperone
MHPGYMPWWRARQAHAEARTACGPQTLAWECAPGSYTEVGAGSLGVRRPLRFLARRLELDDKQVATLARIIADLKTERAQAEVDDRRAVAILTDVVGAPTFDAARAKEAGDARSASAQRLNASLVAALGRIHAVLDDEQREQLAYLIRTGALAL